MFSKKDSCCKKCSFECFTGYEVETHAFPLSLCIKIPQMNGYVKYFNDNKCMNLLSHDREFLKKKMKYLNIYFY